MAIGFFRQSAAPDNSEHIRTHVRQRSILKIQSKTDNHPDNNDWMIHYPLEHTEWLADLLEALNFKFTPKQILETEAEYPGLWDDVAVILWQRRIIADQLKANHG